MGQRSEALTCDLAGPCAGAQSMSDIELLDIVTPPSRWGAGIWEVRSELSRPTYGTPAIRVRELFWHAVGHQRKKYYML